MLDKGVCMLPGTATAGEMEQAMALGLEAVKFFTAEQNGGIAQEGICLFEDGSYCAEEAYANGECQA